MTEDSYARDTYGLWRGVVRPWLRNRKEDLQLSLIYVIAPLDAFNMYFKQRNYVRNAIKAHELLVNSAHTNNLERITKYSKGEDLATKLN